MDASAETRRATRAFERVCMRIAFEKSKHARGAARERDTRLAIGNTGNDDDDDARARVVGRTAPVGARAGVTTMIDVCGWRVGED